MRPLPDVIARYIAAYNDRDVDAMLACLAETIHFENRAGGIVTAAADDKAAFAAMAHAGVTAFAERRQTVRHAITVGDTTLVEIDYAATVAVDLPNGWSAGQRLAFRGASLFRVRDGLIDRLVDES
jgi:ketosteroid isomerase-like protein